MILKKDQGSIFSSEGGVYLVGYHQSTWQFFRQIWNFEYYLLLSNFIHKDHMIIFWYLYLKSKISKRKCKCIIFSKPSKNFCSKSFRGPTNRNKLKSLKAAKWRMDEWRMMKQCCNEYSNIFKYLYISSQILIFVFDSLQFKESE